jgi:hypothetical protein
MIGFAEKNKDDDDDDKNDDDDDDERPTDEWVQKNYSLRCDDLLTHAPLVKAH